MYGNTQYYEEISDKDKNLSKLAEQKLKSLSKITSTMNISGLNSDGAMGQFFVGDPIYVEERNTGMVGGYWVRNVSHTFLADDAIQLDFDLTATEDIPEIQYDNSKTQSSSCKGKRRPLYTFVRVPVRNTQVKASGQKVPACLLRVSLVTGMR